MRHQHLKLLRGHSTRAERIFMELLKELHIPFRCKVMIEGREVDFLVKNLAIEINGHPQKISKNSMLAELGYNPINFDNDQVLNNRETTKQTLKQLYDNSTYNSHLA